jgi:hypothetical protein
MIGVAWGCHRAEQLREAGASRVFAQMGELRERLLAILA